MAIPIWFLDIDGAVNVAGLRLPDHLSRTEATTEGVTWPIHYSPEVVSVVNTVHRSGLAEIRWLTTWGQDARTSFAPAVGLDEFPAYDMFDGERWWKFEIVTNSIASEGRPFVWTDDDLTEAGIADIRACTDVQSILIAPRTDDGLTAVELSRITDFLALMQIIRGSCAL